VTAVIEQCGFPLPGDGLRRQKVSHNSKGIIQGLIVFALRHHKHLP
jgi:hypothetical protein